MSLLTKWHSKDFRKKVKFFNTIFLLTSFILLGFSQKKFEQEIRIRKNSVPVQALLLMDTFNLSGKIKWYQEIGFQRTSYEAKLKHQDAKYSIEFSADGSLEDVEMDIAITSLAEELKSKITEHLFKLFTKYTVEKIQVQYTGLPVDIARWFHQKVEERPLQKKYELVVTTKSSGIFKSYECLFAEHGDLLNYTEIIPKNTDHIEY